MFSQTPVSYLVFNNPPMPKRHWKRDLSIINLHDKLSMAILNNSDLIKNSPAARAEMLHLALLYEGAQINSLLEEALISRLTVTDEKSGRNIIPISMAKIDDLLEARILGTMLNVEKAVQEASTFLSNKTYAFDTLVYDQDSKNLRWLHMAYGLAEQPKLIKIWQGQSENSALLLQRLIEQYYGKVIDSVEIACIDPLLEQSRNDIAVWSLRDADQFIGIIGTADKIEICREEALNDLNIILNTLNRRNDESLLKQLKAELRTFVHTANQNEPSTEIKVFVPQ